MTPGAKYQLHLCQSGPSFWRNPSTTVKAGMLSLLLTICSLAFAQQNEAADSLTQIKDIQRSSRLPLFSTEAAVEFDRRRFWISAGSGAAIYTGLSITLWNAWYKDYPLGAFHTFNDWGEWLQMDKAGHFFSAYTASNYAFQGARWTGMKRSSSRWTAIGIGTGIQATIEIMDGFSKEWGFSVGDIVFNTLGVSFFAVQDLIWQEQRILMKASGIRPDYSNQAIQSTNSAATTTLEERAAGLYGTSFFHVILKDYNALTIWSSGNLRSFIKNDKASWIPPWLNIALGYGGENIFGGFENRWVDNGSEFILDKKDFPRYRQIFLSPDIDFTRIPTRHRWLKFTLGLLNWVKMPAPALECNTNGKIRLRPFYW